jgi:hypothetical protein
MNDTYVDVSNTIFDTFYNYRMQHMGGLSPHSVIYRHTHTARRCKLNSAQWTATYMRLKIHMKTNALVTKIKLVFI